MAGPSERDEDGPDYWQLQLDLSEKLSQPDEFEHIRTIAREEADKRIVGWLLWGGFIAATAIWGWKGALAGIGLVLLYFWLEARQSDRRPGGEPHRIVSHAEDYVRLQIISEAFAAGGPTWQVKDKEYDRDEKKIVVADSDRWDDASERMYNAALHFQKLSPLQRKKCLRRAAKEARPALEQGDAMAKAEGAKLVYWASDALSGLRRS